MEVLAARCACCRRPAPDPWCAACRAGLGPAPTGLVPGVGAVHAAFAYDGTGADAVRALKYRDGRRLVGPLADRLVAALPGELAEPSLVTWVPTAPGRRRRRGFDQSELLARAVARRLGVPCRGLLRRRPGGPQSGRGRAGRLATAGFDARGRAPAGRAGAVLVVDDVCTTGATLAAACAALGGPASTVAACVARVP